MDDLVRWLGEQLDEDERIARATLWDDEGALGSGGWYAYDRGPRDGFREARWVVIDRADEGVMDSRPQAADDQAVARHIAEHDPARVLREIDVKRRALARHCAAPVPPGNEWAEAYPYCAAHAYKGPDGTVIYPVELKDCPELRDLAAPYADRPGYREEWRP